MLGMALLLSAAGCRSAPYVWVHDLPPEPQTPGVRKLVIGPGDMLDIRVGGDEKMSTRGRVIGDGTLVMPLLGPVVVTGKKPEELASSLETALKRYINVPAVTVLIDESQLSVAVIGEVKQAGVVALESPATVIQALAKAGGMTEFADRSSIFVLRPTGDKIQRIRFKYSALVEAEPSATRFRLKTGDALVVE